MQYHAYLQNHARGSSPPFRDDPPGEDALRPAGPEEEAEESPPEMEREDPASPDDESPWRDEGGEG